MAESPLLKEFNYYLAHQDELVRLYSGKFIVIKDGQVLGAYDDELFAVTETIKTEEAGTFLVQLVLPGEAATLQIFHSRVVFT